MRKAYLLIIELFWWLEHRKSERLACIGFVQRKNWEHRYIAKFNENIYGDKL